MIHHESAGVKARVDARRARLYTRCVDSERVAADYIRAHRADESDGTIRAALFTQGFSSDQLDEAFRLAGPRPETPRPVLPARSPEQLRFRVWLFAGTAALFLLVLFALPGLLWLKNPRTAMPQELQDYVASPLPEPAHLARFLPSGLKDEDAAEDYKEIIVSPDGPMSVGPEQSLPPPSPAQLAALERALTKRRCALVVALARPGFEKHLASMAARTRLFDAFGGRLFREMQEAQGRGEWAAAETAARRLVLFGWHAAQEPDLTSQGWGGRWAILGMRGVRDAATAGGTADASLALDVERAVLDLRAYAADPGEAEKIRDLAADPAELSGLLARLKSADGRRAYAGWILLVAATNWSPSEAALARPDPRRTAFFAEAVLADDPGLKVLAGSAATMMRDVERSVDGVPAGERERALREFAGRAGFDPKKS